MTRRLVVQTTNLCISSLCSSNVHSEATVILSLLVHIHVACRCHILYLTTVLIMPQGGYYRNIENSTIIAFAALGLFSAAGSMYLLKQWGKQPHNDWHKM